jgi:hypothetical protein
MRTAAIKGLIAILFAATLTASLPRSASAQSTPWWPGDAEVILGYGCTAVELEPYDSRFRCPAWASHVHEGMDIDLPFGTPIYAGWPGVVTEVGGHEAHDYGAHYVKIWLDEGHDVLLGHLSHATVVRGQRAEIGTLLGYVGDLGVADIPNLDFGARAHGGGPKQSIDPARFLTFLDRSQTSQSFAARDVTGQIQILSRSEVDGRAWSMNVGSTRTVLPGGPLGGFASEPVVAGDGRGHLVAFGVGVDGVLWTASELPSLGGTSRWRAWASLGRPAGAAYGLVGTPAVGLDPGGRLHAFVRSAGGSLWEARQSRAGGRWSQWAVTPFGRQVAGDPVVARDSANGLEVFAPAGDGQIIVRRQAHGGGPWSGWLSLGTPAGGETGFSGRIAVLRDAAGLLEVFVVTANGWVSASMQSSVNHWAAWSQIGRGSAVTVAAVVRSDRSVQVVTLNQSGAVLTTVRQGKAWSAWTTLGYGLAGGIATTFGAAGSVVVFSGSTAHAFAVRSIDLHEVAGPSRGLVLAADTMAQAWTQLPSLPRPVGLGFARVGL